MSDGLFYVILAVGALGLILLSRMYPDGDESKNTFSARHLKRARAKLLSTTTCCDPGSPASSCVFGFEHEMLVAEPSGYPVQLANREIVTDRIAMTVLQRRQLRRSNRRQVDALREERRAERPPTVKATFPINAADNYHWGEYT